MANPDKTELKREDFVKVERGGNFFDRFKKDEIEQMIEPEEDQLTDRLFKFTEDGFVRQRPQYHGQAIVIGVRGFN